jgi:hypothetical protein
MAAGLLFFLAARRRAALRGENARVHLFAARRQHLVSILFTIAQDSASQERRVASVKAQWRSPMRGMSNSNRLSARNPSLDDFFLCGQPGSHTLAEDGSGTNRTASHECALVAP